MSDLAQRLSKLSPAKRQLMERMLQAGQSRREPIAVVGMSCRFAQASNPADYWKVIHGTVNATGPIPSSRWDVDAFFDPSGEVPGRMSTRWGGFLDGVDQFDPLFFGISPRETEKMDPQQRLMLEVAWEALEYGGLAAEKLHGSPTGVFVGVGGLDYSRIPIRYDDYFQRIDAHSGTGNTLSIVANRLSYLFDFRGPSLAVDTACSSSLVAVHLAIRSLRSGECDTALAGGVNLILSPETTIAFSKARMLSPDGQCRPYDAAANGYVRGEGCGVVVLKRLEDAVQANDTVFAVIRGSAINQDGRTSGITAPNAISQLACIQQALADAELSADDITYIEGHGTGTPLGDPLEVEALRELFPQTSRTQLPCYLGSVKANIGHTETAAGIASLVKTVLMLKHRQVPRQLNFQKLNPHMSLDGTRLRIAREGHDWVADGRHVAGISAFGFGGTNAHVLVEEAPPMPKRQADNPDRPQHVCTLSAKTDGALRQLASSYEKQLSNHPNTCISDFCYTANAGRSHFSHRAAITAAHNSELAERLAVVARGERAPGIQQGTARLARRPQVAFLFAGQGAQYPGMAKQLFETQPLFRKTLEECNEILLQFMDHSILEVMFAPDGEASRLHDTLNTQPALFVLEYALAKMWVAWGIKPSVLLGHSIGEYAAACYADVFSLEDGLRLVAGRARLMSSLRSHGAMLVVFAKEADVSPLLQQYPAVVAAINGPENTVVSGEAEAIKQLEIHFADQGVRTQPLNVSQAFHSPLMDPILDEFQELAQSVRYRPPSIPIAANLTGALIADQPLDADYWVSHLRQTVRFADGVDRVAEMTPDVVLEIGPSTTVSAMARRCWRDSHCAWVASLRTGLGDWQAIEQAASELYIHGVNLNWSEFDRPWPRKRLALPTYPFQRNTHWYTDGPGGGVRFPQQSDGESQGHCLLGHRISTPLPQTLYETTLSPSQPDFLVDHQLQGTPLTPAAVYIEQGFAAAEQVFGTGSHAVENLSVQQAMTLPEGDTRTVHLALAPENKIQSTLEVYSRITTNGPDPDDWQLHACGTLRTSTQPPDMEPLDLSALRRQTPALQDRTEFYQEMAARQLVYGPSFQVLDQLRRGDGVALAAIDLPESVCRQLDQYHAHPALLDAGLQAMAGVVPLESDGGNSPYTYVPTHIRQAQVFRRPSGSMWVYVVRTSAGDQPSPEVVEADVLLLDDGGDRIAQLTGVRIQRLGQPIARSAQNPTQDWAYQIHWHPQSISTYQSGDGQPQEGPSRQWLIFADGQGVAESLAAQLRLHGDACRLVFPRLDDTCVENDVSEAISPLADAAYDRLLASCEDGANGSWLGIIHLWSLDIARKDLGHDTAFENGRQLGCGSVLQLLRALDRSEVAASSLCLVTRGGQIRGEQESPAIGQSPLWGFGRAVAKEKPDLQCVLADLDPNAETETCARQLAAELQERSGEQQVMFREGHRYVARLNRVPELLSEACHSESSKAPRSPEFRLRLTTPGTFDALGYEPLHRNQPDAGQVEIAVHSVGLNFSDVLKAMGLYPGISDAVVPMGIECSGVVASVGPGVERFRAGDEVFGIVPYGFASHAITAEFALQAKSAGISHQDACTIPVTFLTAYYSLLWLARLQPGERVLIHAGAGGVGLSAVQIAQHVGAEVFATAGSDTKRELLKSLGVRHVFNSRTLEFADEILEITNHQGVDVVLNSLPGEAIAKSLSILSAYGRFLEIGKTDIYQNRMIGLMPFQDNLSYHAIDLDRMLRQRPDKIRQLFDEVMAHFEEGVFQPLPSTVFDADKIVDAFRYMAQRKNIGKVVVSMETQESTDATAQPQRTIRNDSSYLITGGLGALGMQLAERLVSLGARHLLLLSRRGSQEEDSLKALERLRAAGANVLMLKGDVCERSSLQSALERIPDTFPPIRGVIHAAGVLADGLLHNMDQHQLQQAMRPKVQGAWNLHEVTRNQPLDYFILFSSVASLFGSPGQANYAAGNAFLDGLAQFRTAQGLPATAINWGPWGQSGMAVRSGRTVASRGVKLLDPDQALELFEIVLRAEPSNVAVMDVEWPELLAQMRGHSTKFLEQFASNESAPSGHDERDTEFLDRLREADSNERVQMLRDFIADEVARVMSIDRGSLDLDQPLSTFGLDSLIGMELKAQIETQLGLNLPMSALVEGPSVTSLSAHVASALSGADEDEASEGAEAISADLRIWSPVMALAEGESRLPLYCVHPVGGDTRCYLELAKQFAGRRPVYALRPRGLDQAEVCPASMTEMALDYIQAIRQFRPEGPYHLCGWSTGGIFAYEMARQLRPEDLGTLLFLDTPTPSIFQDVDLDDQARFLFDLVNFSNWFAGTKMRVSYAELKAMDRDLAFETLLTIGKQHGVLSANLSVEYFHRLMDVCREHVRLIQNYRLEEIDQPVTMFQPEDTSALAEASGQPISGDLGWGKVLGGLLTTQTLPGNHFSMMTGDHASALAMRLAELLEAADARLLPD